MDNETREKLIEKENKSVEDYKTLANYYADKGRRLTTVDGGLRYATVSQTYAILALVTLNEEIIT